MSRVWRILLGAFLATVLIFFLAAPEIVDSRFNKTIAQGSYHASPASVQLQSTLLIADLHADSLLWGRDLLERSTHGHVDVPRLIAGNVALQVFSVPTKTPKGLNIERNSESSDQIFWLALLQRWPPSTWNSLTERALYQARRLQTMASNSHGVFCLVRNRNELIEYLEQRRQNPNLTAGLLSIEGAHALDGQLANVDKLYDAGYRMIAPVHFFDNDIAGSSAGVHKTGLTEKGRSLIRLMESKRMIVDLAHASSQTIDDVLLMASRPVVVSHTGVKATCNNNRNLSDEQIRGIARTGGLIGIGYWSTASCGTDAMAIAHAIAHVVKLVGVEHAALGSDFDGAVQTPFDTTGLVEITDALSSEGLSEKEIRLVMGANALRFLEQNLPVGDSAR